MLESVPEKLNIKDGFEFIANTEVLKPDAGKGNFQVLALR